MKYILFMPHELYDDIFVFISNNFHIIKFVYYLIREHEHILRRLIIQLALLLGNYQAIWV